MKNEIIFLIFGVVLCAAQVYSCYPNLRQIVYIRRTPAGYISAFPYEGQVKVSGKAGAAAAESPITHTSCAFWQVEIQRRTGGKTPRWKTIYSRTSTQPFEVSDEASRIFVQPEGAVLILNDDLSQSSGLTKSLDQQTLDAVQGLGVDTTGFLGLQRTLRVAERWIKPGEDVFALGQIKIVDGRRQIAALDKGPLIIADRPEALLLRWLTARVALRLALIPMGYLFICWLFYRG